MSNNIDYKQLSKDQLLQSLNIKIGSLNLEQSDEIFKMISDHLHEVILETVLANINKMQEVELRASLQNDQNDQAFYSVLEKISSGIPGLNVKIEQAIVAELQTIKAARAQLN